VENLVKENDHRLDLAQAASDNNVVDVPPPTDEYVHNVMVILINGDCREGRRLQAYRELIRHLPIVKKKIDDLDPTEISKMYKAVWQLLLILWQSY
jgi:hypothetical protein